MDAPDSFWKLAMRFHQDTLSFVDASEPALAAYLVRGLSAAERQELAGFLDKVLAGPDANTRLHAIWKRSQAELGFSDTTNMVELHRLIRQRL